MYTTGILYFSFLRLSICYRSCIFHSCIFHPCCLLPHFPLLHFPTLLSTPAFSTPAFSAPPPFASLVMIFEHSYYRIYWIEFHQIFTMVGIWFDLTSFPIAQRILPWFWQPILGSKLAKLFHSPSFNALAFETDRDITFRFQKVQWQLFIYSMYKFGEIQFSNCGVQEAVRRTPSSWSSVYLLSFVGRWVLSFVSCIR